MPDADAEMARVVPEGSGVVPEGSGMVVTMPDGSVMCAVGERSSDADRPPRTTIPATPTMRDLPRPRILKPWEVTALLVLGGLCWAFMHAQRAALEHATTPPAYRHASPTLSRFLLARPRQLRARDAGLGVGRHPRG